jgi:iron complex transport system ATP-binding protein
MEPIVLHDVSLVRAADGHDYSRGERLILDRVTWWVSAAEQWIVLGRNGCGKTSLIRICAAFDHASSGTVDLLGERIGKTDVRRLRSRIGFVSAAMAAQVRPALSCHDVVMTARHGALEPWWHRYSEADHAAARAALERFGLGWAGERTFGSMSSGERQRVLLARQFMAEPELLLLDEPNAGLDLTGREELLADLNVLATDATAPPLVLVTHHVEEIPPGFTHLLALRRGVVVATGPLHETLNDELLGEVFELPISLTRHDDGRYAARARARA